MSINRWFRRTGLFSSPIFDFFVKDVVHSPATESRDTPHAWRSRSPSSEKIRLLLGLGLVSLIQIPEPVNLTPDNALFLLPVAIRELQ